MKALIKRNKSDLVLFGIFLAMILVLIMLAILPQAGNIGTNKPYSPVALDLGFASVRWYAVFIVSGLIMGAIFARTEFKRLGWKADDLLDGLIIIAPLAILGARVYYVLFHEDTSSIGDFFSKLPNITDGGLAIHGAIIVATIGVIIFSKYKKLNLFLLFDLLAVGLLIGQITGRWGNFMNAEAHGDFVNAGSFIEKVLPNFIKHQMLFDGSMGPKAQMYHPAFLYESSWNFVGLVTLLILRRIKFLKPGDLMAIYLIWYGVGRSYIEYFYRTDQLTGIINVLPVNVFLSLLLLVGGGTALLILKRVFIKDEQPYVDYIVNNLKYPWDKIDEKNKSDNI